MRCRPPECRAVGVKDDEIVKDRFRCKLMIGSYVLILQLFLYRVVGFWCLTPTDIPKLVCSDPKVSSLIRRGIFHSTILQAAGVYECQSKSCSH